MKDLIHRHCDLVHHYLDGLDRTAADNVRAGTGGPFSARIVLFTKNAEGTCTPFHEFPITTNMVLKSGIASHHAEAEALDSTHMAALKEHIRRLSFVDRLQAPVVVLFSSAQPCMACLTKIEIAARHLVQRKLIAPKDFLLIYGATYAQTEAVAGFYDYAYALDFFSYGHEDLKRYHLIRTRCASLNDAPTEVRDIMRNNALIEAALVKEGEILGVGYDQRTPHNLYETAECVAIHAASRALREAGSQTPWNLRGATLYTTNADIGPLSYAEGQWAGITDVVLLKEAACLRAQNTKALDCPDCTNPVFFQKIAQGYNTPWSAIHVLCDPRFPNLGQQAWAAQTTRVCYNGCEADPALTAAEKQIFDSLFIPDILADTAAELP